MTGGTTGTVAAEHDPRRVVVFLGPTLSAAAARTVLDADLRPPAAQGDVWRATMSGATAIVLIDGRFGNVPAVWHKEILAALAAGVPVLGAASMGALRAAELADFGMEGYGRIFDCYRRGDLVADDAVAVAHAGPEAGFRRLSDALVDIHATLDAAVAADVLDPTTAARIAATAGALHYPQRTWDALLDQHPHELLRAWLPTGRVEQKRRDAELVLHVVAARLTTGLHRRHSNLVVEDSQVWARVKASTPPTGGPSPGGHLGAVTSTGSSADPTDVPFDLVADELRLTPGRPAPSRWAGAYREALLRHAMLELAGAWQLGRPDLQSPTADDRVRAERDVLRRVEALIHDSALARVPAVLDAAGDLAPAVARAQLTHQFLAELGGVVPSAADAGFSIEDLLADHQSAEPPLETVAPPRRVTARAAGFATEAALVRALVLRRLARRWSDASTREPPPAAPSPNDPTNGHEEPR